MVPIVAAALKEPAAAPVLPKPDCADIHREIVPAPAEPDCADILLVAELEALSSPCMPGRGFIFKEPALEDLARTASRSSEAPIEPELEVGLQDEVAMEPIGSAMPAEPDRDVISKDEATVWFEPAPVPFDKVLLDPSSCRSSELDLIVLSSSDTTTTSR